MKPSIFPPRVQSIINCLIYFPYPCIALEDARNPILTAHRSLLLLGRLPLRR